MLRRAVFLDRDGVLNEPFVERGKPLPPRSMNEIRLIPSATLAVKRLVSCGLFVSCVTNQPDVARGVLDRSVAEAINGQIASESGVNELLACFHDDGDNCGCRKPKPGLLLTSASRNCIDLEKSFMVGDRWRDIDAGRAAGCQTILVDYRWQERTSDSEPDTRVRSLLEATDWIMSRIGDS